MAYYCQQCGRALDFLERKVKGAALCKECKIEVTPEKSKGKKILSNILSIVFILFCCFIIVFGGLVLLPIIGLIMVVFSDDHCHRHRH